MTNKQTIQLTISKDYVSDWGVWEGVREFLQNARDSEEFEVSYSENSMSISSFSGPIDKKYLILGNTTKRNDSSTIGTYGEGFKLALLVLLREGKKVAIHNGKDVWTPIFDTHVELGNECLNIIIEKDVLTSENEVKFVIEGLTADEISLIQENSLYDKKLAVEASHEGSYCWRARGNPKIYVGGLFVCNLNKKYLMSYDFSPNVLQLDRDRKTICTFSVSYNATKMITLSGNYDLLSYLAEKEAEDISDYFSFEEAHYYYGSGSSSEESLNPTEKLKAIVSESFVLKHGEKAYPINSQWDEKQKKIKTIKCIEAGFVPVVIKAGYYGMLSKGLTTKELEDFKFNISEEIINFFENNKKHLRSKSKKELERIVNMIKMIEGKDLPVDVEKQIVVDTYSEEFPF